MGGRGEQGMHTKSEVQYMCSLFTGETNFARVFFMRYKTRGTIFVSHNARQVLHAPKYVGHFFADIFLLR